MRFYNRKVSVWSERFVIFKLYARADVAKISKLYQTYNNDKTINNDKKAELIKNL